MTYALQEKDWELLVSRIARGRCTPLLGPGMSADVLPSFSKIAQEWASKYGYPFEDPSDLVRVAQFLAVSESSLFPKQELARRLNASKGPDFNAEDDPHRILAGLPLPIYMTSNYDSFMFQSLEQRRKSPKREICRWNKPSNDIPTIFQAGFRPSAQEPVVYHLHGAQQEPASLVLTEDDYLDFLVNISNNENILPPRIQQALTGSSLLFIGYRLADWSFRTLFRGLVISKDSSLRRINVAIQLPSKQDAVQNYLTEYLRENDTKVYWGTARQFAAELRRRCQERGALDAAC